jgi:tRNA dimethylallyltransferase
MSLPPVVVVVGATAAGKSGFATALAQRLGRAEIVNADSMQLYRGLDIGTAKVPPAERQGIRHHLLDVLDVEEPASVAEFQLMARAAIDGCRARGVTPIVVGGSSLYVRAVIDQLEFPGTDPAVRARWAVELERVGSPALHAVLTDRDPAAAAAILPGNGRRIVRALEVIELTGEAFAATLPAYESRYRDLVLIGLEVPRDVLDERISARVDAMWTAGLVEEVKQLPIDGTPTASRAIGYQQVLAFLRGELDEAEARERIAAATRKFARRQDRMFHQDPRVHWLGFASPSLLDDAVGLLAAP